MLPKIIIDQTAGYPNNLKYNLDENASDEEITSFVQNEVRKITTGFIGQINNKKLQSNIKAQLKILTDYVCQFGFEKPPIYICMDKADPTLANICVGKITADFFYNATGNWPELDDLDRVNCSDTTSSGHSMCGWCYDHNLPRFRCGCINSQNI